MKKWKYHTSHRYKNDGVEVYALTQLYQIGIYMIVNGDPRLQFNMTPNQMMTLERKLRKNKDITDLEFGIEITVITDEDSGLYKELKEEALV